MINVLPWLFAPKAYKCRRKLARALQHYFSDGSVDSASVLVKARYAVNQEHGISTATMAQLEFGNLIGLLGNTAPALFWLLVHVYSDLDLLGRLRREVDGIILVRGSKVPGQPFHCLDVEKIRVSCPLMLSTYQEVLRTRSRAMSSRVVLEDTVVDERYLLHKDCYLQMPSYVLHADKASWGPNVQQFDPERFLKRHKSDGDYKPRSGTFRAFGGGQSLCSGRHFATMEDLASFAMIVARYDITLSCGTSATNIATRNSLVDSFEMPAEAVKVRVLRRPDRNADENWEFATPISRVNFSNIM